MKSSKIVNSKINEIGNKKYSLDHLRDSLKYIEKCISEIEIEIEGVRTEKNTFSDAVNELDEKVTCIKNEINNLCKE